MYATRKGPTDSSSVSIAGDIDLGECLRIKGAFAMNQTTANGSTDEMARVEAEDTNPFADLMADLAVHFDADGEESTPEKGRPS